MKRPYVNEMASYWFVRISFYTAAFMGGERLPPTDPGRGHQNGHPILTNRRS